MFAVTSSCPLARVEGSVAGVTVCWSAGNIFGVQIIMWPCAFNIPVGWQKYLSQAANTNFTGFNCMLEWLSEPRRSETGSGPQL